MIDIRGLRVFLFDYFPQENYKNTFQYTTRYQTKAKTSFLFNNKRSNINTENARNISLECHSLVNALKFLSLKDAKIYLSVQQQLRLYLLICIYFSNNFQLSKLSERHLGLSLPVTNGDINNHNEHERNLALFLLAFSIWLAVNGIDTSQLIRMNNKNNRNRISFVIIYTRKLPKR